MPARFKITRTSAPTATDPEGVIGHVGFVWKPDEFDEITLSRWAGKEDGRKMAGRIETMGRVTVFSAPVREFEDKKTGQVGHFLALDGLSLPFDVSREIVAAALPAIDEARKATRLADDAGFGHDPAPDDAATDAADIPF